MVNMLGFFRFLFVVLILSAFQFIAGRQSARLVGWRSSGAAAATYPLAAATLDSGRTARRYGQASNRMRWRRPWS